MRKKKIISLLMCLMLILTANEYVRGSHNERQENGLLLEQDDFESQEEYEAYLAEHPEVEEQQYTEIPEGALTRATPGATDSKPATKVYSITGLPENVAIQKTYIGTNYIYVLQRKGTTSYLSRCLISGSTATYQDHMQLNRFGHTQTLEMFQRNGKTYFWIGCKANENYTYNWAIQLARIQYSPSTDTDGNGVIDGLDYTKCYRFTYLNRANATGTSFGDIKRADVALSSNGNKLFLWVQDEDGEIQYSYYNANVLNAELDSLEAAGGTKYTSFANATIKAACYGSFRQSGSDRVLPNGSCQGVEFNDADNIFIIGGNRNEPPKIAKLNGSGNNYTYSKLITINNSVLQAGHNAETEGIQLKGDYIYFGIYNKEQNQPNKWLIYRIAKSVF